MAQVVEELISKISVQGDDKYIRAMGRMAKASHDLGRAAGSAGSSIISSLLNPVNLLIGTVTAGGILGLVAATVNAAAEMESLKLGMAAVTPELADISGELERLKEIAKLPGLGFTEVIEGFTKLKAAGLDIQLAERSLLAFGNALATVGYGKDRLQLVNLALTQMANKTTGFGQEVRQLTEHIPQLQQALRSIFGTGDSEAIAEMGFTGLEVVKMLVAHFETLPKVTGGARNSFENFMDTVKRGMATFGAGLLPAVMRGLDAISTTLDKLEKNGAIAKLGRDLGEVLGKALDTIVLPGLNKLMKIISDINQAGGLLEWAKQNAAAIAKFALTITATVFALSALFLLVAIFTKNLLLGTKALLGMIAAIAATEFIKSQLQGLQGMKGRPIGSGGTTDNGLGPDGVPNPSSQAGTIGGPLGLLGQIAQNTSMTADNTKRAIDIKRFALGGGPLGQIGVTPVEIGGFKRNGRSGQVVINITGDPATIERTVLGLRRKGLL